MRERLPSSERRETPGTINPIPKHIASEFVHSRDTFGQSALMVHEGDKTKINRVFEREENIPGAGKGMLVLDYRRYHQPDPKKFDRLQFEYRRVDPELPDQEQIVGQIHCQVIPDGSFTVDHRHIHPEFRRKFGLGTLLYQQAENFVQQVANERQSDVVLRMQAGQESVIEWAKKMGFVVIPEHQHVLDALRDHPEDFVVDDAFVSEESRAEGIVKDRYTFHRNETTRFMENAIRVTMKKVIHPKK